MAKISVIVPVYNAENYLADCVESVLKQTYCDWEMLLVDDGSTDSSAEIGEKYAARDKRIRLLRNAHGGVGAARNLGLAAASGMYITFLDSDDWLDAHCFEAALQEMSNNIYIYIFGIRRMPVGALHCIEKEICTPCNEIEELDFIALLGRNYISSVCGILFRSELIFDTRFDEAVSMGEDLCFIFEALHRAKNRELKATPEAYYNYRMHAGSLTTTCDEQRINGLKKTYECLYSELSRRNFTGGAYKKFVSKRLLSDIYYLSHVVESSSLCVEEKEKRRVDLAKVNLLRKRDFAKSADTGHSYKLLTVQLSCSLFYFKAQKNLDRYTSALQRRIGRR